MRRTPPLPQQYKVLFRKHLYVHDCPDGKVKEVVLVHYELLPAPPVAKMIIKGKDGAKWRVNDIVWEQDEQAYAVDTQESTYYTGLTNFIKMLEEQGWFCLAYSIEQPAFQVKEVRPYKMEG